MGLELEGMTKGIIGAAIRVQKGVGPGLLESAYRMCLSHELRSMGWTVQEEVPLEVHYQGLVIPQAYRMDLVVEDRVVIELKAIEKLIPAHEAQLLTYLRFSGYPVGLLFNFWAFPLSNGGIKRLAYTSQSSAPSASPRPPRL